MKHAHPLQWLFAIVLLVGPAAFGIEPAELVDSELNRQQVQFVNLAGGDLSFFDNERRLRRVAAEDFVALRLTARAATAVNTRIFDEADSPGNSGSPGSPGAADRKLTLNDGHVLAGSFGGVKDGKLLWVTAAFGVVPVELDNVVRMAVTESQVPAKATAVPAGAPGGGGDQVVLINGDVVGGFIESVSETGLKLDANGQKLDLPWDRVARIILPNPVNRGPGTWVRLADGTQVKVEQAAFDSQKLTGTIMGREVEVPGEAVRSIDFATKHRRVPLAELEPRLISGGQVFGVPMPPAPGSGGDEQLALHAPVTLEYTLPANARRFAADAMLNEADLAWADLTLVVTDGKGDLFRQRLNAETPEARLNVPLKTGELVIELEEGVNGPIRDRLTLDRAAILVEVK